MKKTDIIVKKSKIHKKGVFANRDFKKGEVVLKWKPKILRKSEIKKLSAEEKHYVYQDENTNYFLMQIPEKYVNHSCDANTKVGNQCDITIRDIKKGEEITSDYGEEGSFISFKCECGSKNCRGRIGRK
jgi:SET domain-containing protein